MPPLRVSYPADLPITARKEELLAAVRDHPVVVVAGETGSGKSTQLPKICLELGRGDGRLIGHTQPRRLAARTIAERVAEELGTDLGDVVGYAVRFTDRVSERTRVKVMTDGILLAELQRDRKLSRYDTIIVDEAHERSLNIDFILGYLKGLLAQRQDLRVIVTSATIDTARFSSHFDGAPVVEVSGRSYPVEIRYRPLDDAGEGGTDQTQAICDAVEELRSEGQGDILVFLSGEREIHDTADAVRAMALPDTDVLPLYARLAAAEQHRVFQPHRGRRVVLATNVAETSLTVPGIRYVIDAGTARVSRYNRRTKVQRLPVEPISRASADQRAGRCGRVAPGICIRLYSEEDLAARPEFTEPEILRTNLASVILQMTAIGLGDVASFPFVEPPDVRSIKDGVALLEELGAIQQGRERPVLTPAGRSLARLPLDPRLGRMVLEAHANACLREVLVIAAALSIQDPRERPEQAREAADRAHARFADARSDFLAFVRLWDHLREQQRSLSSSQFRKLCRAEFLNYVRVREWQDVYSQLREVCGGLGMRVTTTPADADAIHRSLLAGLLSQVGTRVDDRREYQGPRGSRFAIAPGSVLSGSQPRWVMAAELVETSRLWARVVAGVRPEWIEKAGAHLVRRSHAQPHWDAERGAAHVLERVTIFGLTLVPARRVPLARVDRPAAREMFIRHALLDGDWDGDHEFLRRNARLVDEVSALEHRVRRRGLLVGDDVLFAFYDDRVPAGVASGRDFDRWWASARARQPDLLDFTFELLLDPRAGPVDLEAYPVVWEHGDLRLPVSYRFAPGSDDDGVVVHVPLVALNRVQPAGFDWHVAGYREELVTELIRSLPKAVRRNVVPAPDHARAFLADHRPEDGPLVEVLAAYLTTRTGTDVDVRGFDVDALPAHLRLAFAVHDERGRTLSSAEDLGVLRDRLWPEMRRAVARATGFREREGITAWDFGVIPRRVESEDGVHGYPAIVDEGDAVALRVLASDEEQRRAMWGGTRRLLLLGHPGAQRAVGRALTRETTLGLARGDSPDAIVDDALRAALDKLLAAHGGPAWDREGFERLDDAVGKRLVDEASAVATTAAKVLAARDAVARRLAAAPARLEPALADMRDQVERLLPPHFVVTTGASRLPDLLRYLQAVGRRLDRLPAERERDHERMRRVRALEARYERAAARLPASAELRRVRWMLEELRVSYFAQALGTAGPVSEERISRALAALGG